MEDDSKSKFLKTIEKLESEQQSDMFALNSFIQKADKALKSKDIGQLQSVSAETIKDAEKPITMHNTLLYRFNEIVQTTAIETEGRVKLFIADTDSFSAAMKKYERVNMYLRRIELDIESGIEDAYDYIREQRISPFAIAGILYHMTSRIGHRENVLMKLADDSLEHGEVLRAYGFLTVIRSPSEDALSLKRELGQVIEAMKA